MCDQDHYEDDLAKYLRPELTRRKFATMSALAVHPGSGAASRPISLTATPHWTCRRLPHSHCR